MSESIKKSSMNRDTVNNNETIFEFLKRKKQYNLENTVNKSQRNSSTKRKVDYDIEDDFPQTRDLTKYRTTEQYHSYTSRPNITPKKIQFQEPEIQPKSAAKSSNQYQGQHKRAKSFLNMISPIKNNRPSSALEEKDENKNEQFPSKSAMKTGRGDNFNRKNVTKCINSIKDMVNKLNQNITIIQDKSHGLSVLFKPIFNSIKNPNEQQNLLIGDLKNKLRSFEALVEGASVENSDDILEEFHKKLEDHVQGQLSHLRKELQKEKNDNIVSFRQEKQLQIEKLQLEVKKLTKENDLLNRRFEKTLNNKEKIQEAVTERQITHIEQLQRYKINSEQTLKELTAKNAYLSSQLEAAKEQALENQKRYKNERMVRQSMQDKFREEIQQITEAKDAYLLNEIMVLKSEFNADIARINDLHKIKEAELMDKIAKKEEELKDRLFEKGCDKQLQSKILEEANIIKQQNLALKTKSECIVTDMYRMNEQLYQHWMALKDIKHLSTRLGSYAQFKKIFEELRFNDHLFH